MGRGDRKTRKGKIAIRSYGTARPHTVKKSAAAKPPSTAVKKRQRIAHVQSRRRNDERDDYSWYDNRGNYWTGRAYVDAYYLRAR